MKKSLRENLQALLPRVHLLRCRNIKWAKGECVLNQIVFAAGVLLFPAVCTTLGAAEYGWNIDLGAISKIWRGGCIIRAQFLNRIADAYAETPDLPVLLTAPYFTEAITRAQAPWRRVVIAAAEAGIPAPAFSSSLSYYDGIRADRLPAALVQGQRDFFGAHTYKRVDKPGTFHTLWSGDRTEIEAEDTH